MLYANKVRQALDAQLSRLLELDGDHHQLFEEYGGWLGRLGGMNPDDILSRVEGKSNPGAVPSEDHGSPLIMQIGHRWNNHEEARDWAFQRIKGITTLAVDGSQIKPVKDYSFELAAIQIAWFENPHHVTPQTYVKDATFELIPPDVQKEDGEANAAPSRDVNLRRFEAEVNKIVEHIRRWDHLDPPPVAFFDGTLVASFAAPLPRQLRDIYVGSILRLLEASEQCRVPVVGYVDTSHSRDLCTLMSHVGNLPVPERINDGQLLRHRMNWGDRTRAFVCARQHILQHYHHEAEQGGKDFQREVAFFYLQTTGDGPPARVDIPRWVVREGLVDYVADVVRCEVVAGTGYPYCFEAVDAAAVLSVRDREIFYAQLQEFCDRNGMRLRLVPKAASKRRRRM